MKDRSAWEQPAAIQQGIIQAQANAAEIIRTNMRVLWSQQWDLLACMESVATGWFKRRHAGVQAAAEASERICQADSPQACLREY